MSIPDGTGINVRVCLSAPYAYPLIDASDTSPIGGAERRACLLARGLVKIGTDVDLLVEAPRRFDVQVFDGLRVWNTGDGYDRIRNRVADFWSPGEGRSRSWRWPLLWEVPLLAAVKCRNHMHPGNRLQNIFVRASADVVGVFGVSSRSARLLQTARQPQRIGALFLAANSDLHSEYFPGSAYRSPIGDIGHECAELLASADLIFTQSEEQQRLLKQRFNRNGILLNAPFDFEAWDQLQVNESPTISSLKLQHFFLWVGRADRSHKRPLIALELAKRCPKVSFLMVVNRGDPAIAAELKRGRLPNVSVVEQLPPHEMPALISRARGLISTSARAYEGTPNVFREAAASSTPVLSLEVPGDLLDRADAGRQFSGDLDLMAQAVEDLWRDDDLRARWGSTGRAHVLAHHDSNLVSRTLLQHFERSVSERGSIQ